MAPLGVGVCSRFSTAHTSSSASTFRLSGDTGTSSTSTLPRRTRLLVSEGVLLVVVVAVEAAPVVAAGVGGVVGDGMAMVGAAGRLLLLLLEVVVALGCAGTDGAAVRSADDGEREADAAAGEGACGTTGDAGADDDDEAGDEMGMTRTRTACLGDAEADVVAGVEVGADDDGVLVFVVPGGLIGCAAAGELCCVCCGCALGLTSRRAVGRSWL